MWMSIIFVPSEASLIENLPLGAFSQISEDLFSSYYVNNTFNVKYQLSVRLHLENNLCFQFDHR